jgi:hypothetical protein
MTYLSAARTIGRWSPAVVAGSLLLTGAGIGTARPARAATLAHATALAHAGTPAGAAPPDFTLEQSETNSTTTIDVWYNDATGRYHAEIIDMASPDPLSVSLIDSSTQAVLASANGTGPGDVDTSEVVTNDPVLACGIGATGVEFCTSG